MKDPYETLGVNRSATDREIKDAFKKLARKFHPDLHPGDKEAEAKFKDISAANDLLKDEEKRRRFDAGEIDASGAERPQERFYRDFADGPAYASHATQDGFANNEELEEFLARAFAGGERRSQGTFRARGQDVSYVLPVGFLDVANGSTRTITLPEGKTLQVTVPEGAEDRQMLRLRGQGMPGFGGGPAGDAYVELHVEPHAFFRRKDDNIHVEVPVTLKEAALGARIEVPTIGGPVTVTVPKGSNTGTTLRLARPRHPQPQVWATRTSTDHPECRSACSRRARAGRVSGKLAAENPAGPAQGDAVMMRVDDLVAAISSLQRSDLEAWIREELVVPRQEAGTLLFTDMECARVRLICTLHYELEIDAGTLPVVLSLVDQLYDTRQRLLSLTAAVTAQDQNVQAAIIAAMEPNAGSSGADKS